MMVCIVPDTIVFTFSARAVLQLNSLGRADDELFGAVDLRVTYRTRVYSDVRPDITRAYAVDLHYRRVDRHYFVSVSTDVADGGSSFAVTVNGRPMADPVWRPFLGDEVVVKQMTNFGVVVVADDFRLQFDRDAKIYFRLDARFENKVRE